MSEHSAHPHLQSRHTYDYTMLCDYIIYDVHIIISFRVRTLCPPTPWAQVEPAHYFHFNPALLKSLAIELRHFGEALVSRLRDPRLARTATHHSNFSYFGKVSAAARVECVVGTFSHGALWNRLAGAGSGLQCSDDVGLKRVCAGGGEGAVRRVPGKRISTWGYSRTDELVVMSL